MAALACTIVAAILAGSATPARADDRLPPDPIIDSPMAVDPPATPQVTVTKLDPRMIGLWTWGLGQADADTIRQTVAAILEARSLGFTEVADLTPNLRAVLEAPGQRPLVKLCAAGALIRLEARDAAASLLAHNLADGPDMVLLTDPGLASWKYAPAGEVWLKRAIDPQADRAVRISAFNAMTVAECVPAGAIDAMVADPSVDRDVRLAAAGALGASVTHGLEPAAESLMTSPRIDPTALPHLLAVRLLQKHRGDRAQGLLLRLAKHPQPAVATAALRRLFEIDPGLIQPVARELLTNNDEGVRRWVGKAGLAWRTVEGVALVTPLLDDPNPTLRLFVRDGLMALDSQPELREAVRDGAMKTLGGNRWRGCEQAAILLGKAGHAPAADRLVVLLDDSQPRVRVAAAAALRWLAIPRTLPLILAHATTLTREASRPPAPPVTGKPAPAKKGKAPAPPPEPPSPPRQGVDTDAELAQMFQMFGQMRYADAETLLRRYVPKHSFPWNNARAGAIWSLGFLLQDKPDPSLVSELVRRMQDGNPTDPEAGMVRHMATLNLGRMRAASALASLRQVAADTTNHDLAMVARWCVLQITGEVMPAPPPPIPNVVSNGFLQPLN